MVLLEHSANKDIKDIKGFTALQLAEPTDHNKEEHRKRSGGETQVYKEDSFLAGRARKITAQILRDEGTRSHSDT